ncbi:uncharacterized protein C8Q71DRAFT_873864 [Rhodofomes roseus]|uniref:Uncharacterized protein n=1 Tax=Rhodofomes roseus TaxID=34475 RepID=A0ABQ8KAM7_9APHY|nr:uncharacterized protein C8Q71DRAFT_873864 [Rhodofomes roseus]KAH9834207.1 hypothetical protein C8Q71DRAFT_873864 [Rhodofomes roseus]
MSAAGVSGVYIEEWWVERSRYRNTGSGVHGVLGGEGAGRRWRTRCGGLEVACQRIAAMCHMTLCEGSGNRHVTLRTLLPSHLHSALTARPPRSEHHPLAIDIFWHRLDLHYQHKFPRLGFILVRRHRLHRLALLLGSLYQHHRHHGRLLLVLAIFLLYCARNWQFRPDSDSESIASASGLTRQISVPSAAVSAYALPGSTTAAAFSRPGVSGSVRRRLYKTGPATPGMTAGSALRDDDPLNCVGADTAFQFGLQGLVTSAECSGDNGWRRARCGQTQVCPVKALGRQWLVIRGELAERRGGAPTILYLRRVTRDTCHGADSLYGDGFAADGGGVFVTEFAHKGILDMVFQLLLGADRAAEQHVHHEAARGPHRLHERPLVVTNELIRGSRIQSIVDQCKVMYAVLAYAVCVVSPPTTNKMSRRLLFRNNTRQTGVAGRVGRVDVVFARVKVGRYYADCGLFPDASGKYLPENSLVTLDILRNTPRRGEPIVLTSTQASSERSRCGAWRRATRTENNGTATRCRRRTRPRPPHLPRWTSCAPTPDTRLSTRWSSGGRRGWCRGIARRKSREMSAAGVSGVYIEEWWVERSRYRNTGSGVHGVLGGEGAGRRWRTRCGGLEVACQRIAAMCHMTLCEGSGNRHVTLRTLLPSHLHSALTARPPRSEHHPLAIDIFWHRLDLHYQHKFPRLGFILVRRHRLHRLALLLGSLYQHHRHHGRLLLVLAIFLLYCARNWQFRPDSDSESIASASGLTRQISVPSAAVSAYALPGSTTAAAFSRPGVSGSVRRRLYKTGPATPGMTAGSALRDDDPLNCVGADTAFQFGLQGLVTSAECSGDNGWRRARCGQTQVCPVKALGRQWLVIRGELAERRGGAPTILYLRRVTRDTCHGADSLYGDGFAADGGGVFVTEFAHKGILDMVFQLLLGADRAAEQHVHHEAARGPHRLHERPLVVTNELIRGSRIQSIVDQCKVMYAVLAYAVCVVSPPTTNKMSRRLLFRNNTRQTGVAGRVGRVDVVFARVKVGRYYADCGLFPDASGKYLPENSLVTLDILRNTPRRGEPIVLTSTQASSERSRCGAWRRATRTENNGTATRCRRRTRPRPPHLPRWTSCAPTPDTRLSTRWSSGGRRGWCRGIARRKSREMSAAGVSGVYIEEWWVERSRYRNTGSGVHGVLGGEGAGRRWRTRCGGLEVACQRIAAMCHMTLCEGSGNRHVTLRTLLPSHLHSALTARPPRSEHHPLAIDIFWHRLDLHYQHKFPRLGFILVRRHRLHRLALLLGSLYQHHRHHGRLLLVLAIFLLYCARNWQFRPDSDSESIASASGLTRQISVPSAAVSAYALPGSTTAAAFSRPGVSGSVRRRLYKTGPATPGMTAGSALRDDDPLNCVGADTAFQFGLQGLVTSAECSGDNGWRRARCGQTQVCPVKALGRQWLVIRGELAERRGGAPTILYLRRVTRDTCHGADSLYGDGFAADGGGVFVTEFAHKGILDMVFQLLLGADRAAEQHVHHEAARGPHRLHERPLVVTNELIRGSRIQR